MEEKKELIRQKLTAVRQELLALLSSIEEEEWNKLVYSEGEEWRISDALRHVSSSEREMTEMIERFVKGGKGVPPDFDLARWNARTIRKNIDKTPEQMIAEMSVNRDYLMNVIEGLQAEDFPKSGRHASLRIMSIEEILHLIADHEARHTKDLREVLGR